MSHYQRLPPELRNKIYDMLILEDIPITAPWPAIAGACKSIRRESLSIYFGTTDFVATIVDRNHNASIR